MKNCMLLCVVGIFMTSLVTGEQFDAAEKLPVLHRLSGAFPLDNELSSTLLSLRNTA